MLLTIKDPGLRALHWERLCAPLSGGRWDFLSINQDTPFSLYLPSMTDLRFPPIGRRDLRALVLVAGPGDLEGKYPIEEFDVAGTVRAVRSALGEIPCDILDSVEGADGSPDLNTLSARLTNGGYTLLHVVCHGQVRDGETRLYLPGDDRRPVAATQLIEMLDRISGRSAAGPKLPHFAFLMTCESASPEAEYGFGGLAQRLVRELGLPAVLAMTAPVSIPTANALAAEFYTCLREHGLPDRALSESLAGVMDRPDATVPAVFSRLGGRPLFSDSLDRPLTPAEITDGLGRLLALANDRAPVLMPDLVKLAEKLRGLPSGEGLSQTAQQERATALAETNQLSTEILDLSFNALALGRPVPPYDARCPFPGLAAFGTGDRAFFFGRDALVKTLANQLQEHPFLAVLGDSGTGKSSLVLAGLLPALGDPPVAVFTPGGDPLVRLENTLQELPDHSLIVVDQFEEVFTQCPTRDEKAAFINRLLDLPPACRVIVTMRADFIGECAPFPRLKQAIQLHTELIPPMTPTELRRAIEQQAAAVGLRFEGGLAEAILHDVESESGAMPLLQHALRLVWERRRGIWLRSADYHVIGGVSQAIANTAEKIFADLTGPDCDRLRAIFLFLTNPDENTAQDGEHRDTRRRVAQKELVPPDTDWQSTITLLNRLASARLVTTSKNPVTGNEEVEVAHEALIRHWPRLRHWLDEDRAALRLAEDIRDATLAWIQAGRVEAWLIHRAGRLEDAFTLADSGQLIINAEQVEYLTACRDLQERVQREKDRLVDTSVARLLAYQASDLIAKRRSIPTSMLLAIESLRRYPEGTANQALADGLSIQAKPIARMAHRGHVRSISFSPDSKWVVSSSNDKTARVWEAATGKEITRMTHDRGVLSAAFSPDGKWVVSGSQDRTARIWEAATGKEIARMTHENWVSSVTFSPAGKWVVSSSADKTARVWEAVTGREIARMTHEEIVNSVAFSPNGKWIVSGSDDKTARVWLWRPEDLMALACARLDRNLTQAEWKQYIGDQVPYRQTCPNLPAGE